MLEDHVVGLRLPAQAQQPVDVLVAQLAEHVELPLELGQAVLVLGLRQGLHQDVDVPVVGRGVGGRGGDLRRSLVGHQDALGHFGDHHLAELSPTWRYFVNL